MAAEKDFVGANLVLVLHTLLVDERSAPEIKYNSMVLLSSLMSSGETLQHTHSSDVQREGCWLLRPFKHTAAFSTI